MMAVEAQSNFPEFLSSGNKLKMSLTVFVFCFVNPAYFNG
jgi:hypothetical protein